MVFGIWLKNHRNHMSIFATCQVQNQIMLFQTCKKWLVHFSELCQICQNWEMVPKKPLLFYCYNYCEKIFDCVLVLGRIAFYSFDLLLFWCFQNRHICYLQMAVEILHAKAHPYAYAFLHICIRRLGNTVKFLTQNFFS